MIVIPMAGDSSRFKAAGYKQPKFMLPLDDRPLFDWTVLSFSNYFSSEPFLFIARNSSQTQSFLRERIEILGIKECYCIFLDHLTGGQAETVYLGLLGLGERGIDFGSQSITIFNIDTIRPQIQLTQGDKINAWLEVFKTKGENWSFMLPVTNYSNVVKECIEKVRISDYCCTGLYSFKNAEQFMRGYESEILNRSSHELFVAPIYNHLIDAGELVTWREVTASQVLLSGTPNEYIQLQQINLRSYF